MKMKKWKVIYYQLPENIDSSSACVEIRTRNFEAVDYDHAWQEWVAMIENEKINLDPVWKLSERPE